MLRCSIFGESHGTCIGGLLDGVPPGIPIDAERIQVAMDARRPGKAWTSSRQEGDKVHIQSGVHEGKTTGAPLAFTIANEDARPQDYVHHVARPGHADYVDHQWSGGFNDNRGGGHRSGRLTASLVAAAAILEPLLHHHGMRCGARTIAIAPEEGGGGQPGDDVFLPFEMPQKWVDRIHAARRDGDSLGGTVAFRIDNVPSGLGRPWMDALDARLAAAIMSIPGVKGVNIGAASRGAAALGSHHVDPLGVDGENRCGGILGGRSNGASIWGEVLVKPTPSIRKQVPSINLADGTKSPATTLGRHDPCIAIRVAPVVSAVTSLTILDALLTEEGRNAWMVE